MNQQWMNEWRQLELDCSRLPGQITSILFIYLFYDCIVPLGFLSWDIRIAFPRESRLRQSHATQPTVLSGCFSASIIHRVDYRIFNVCTDVNACDCTQVCRDTRRESARKVDSGRKIPCRTGESNLRQRRGGSMLYQLSYIPAQCTSCPCTLKSQVQFLPSLAVSCSWHTSICLGRESKERSRMNLKRKH